MVCFNCKSQIPDNVTSCPNCGAPVMYQAQVKKEIKLRRYQRWILYVVIAVVFAGMTAYAVKIYLDNAALMSRVASVTQNLEKSRQELEGTKQTLGEREGQLAQSRSEISQLTASQQALTQKTDEYQKTIEAQAQSLQGYRQFSSDLGADNANIFNTLVQLGIGTSNVDLNKLAIADYNLANGTDTDGDGLSDALEDAIGTDKNKADTDEDGYSDKDEVLVGYNPAGTDRMPLDENFMRANSGKILIQIDGQKEAWYVNPQDWKRYYLGRPGDAVNVLQQLQNIQAQ